MFEEHHKERENIIKYSKDLSEAEVEAAAIAAHHVVVSNMSNAGGGPAEEFNGCRKESPLMGEGRMLDHKYQVIFREIARGAMHEYNDNNFIYINQVEEIYDGVKNKRKMGYGLAKIFSELAARRWLNLSKIHHDISIKS